MSTPQNPVREPINVLFVLTSLCVGGAEKQVVSLINKIDRSRFNLSLVTVKEVNDLLGQVDPAACALGIQCLQVPKGFDWNAVRRLAAHIDDKKIDVVVCTNMYPLLYAWLAQRLCSRAVRLVEVFHTTDTGSRKEQLSMMLYRQIVRMTDLMVYVCRGQANHWQRLGLRARQQAVIYNGIDMNRFEDIWSAQDKSALRQQYGFKESDYVVGLCAVMRPEKAHADLLGAAAKLRAEGVDVKCLLIGDGPERARIEATIDALKLTEQARITGMIQDVRATIAACDVIVLTSHAVETFSIAALEAMALGRPMVMTDIGGAREQVEHGQNGLLYEAGDTSALASCLRTLSEAKFRHAASQKAAARVRESFDIRRMVRSYEAAFAALVAQKPVETNA
jgi:glycosyltransferase involved in cell wall biosynthesis